MLKMVDFRDPAVVSQDLCAYYALDIFMRPQKPCDTGPLLVVAVLKFCLTLDGLYM
jgi:hypothetical protein